jgi:hypothetical protein
VGWAPGFRFDPRFVGSAASAFVNVFAGDDSGVFTSVKTGITKLEYFSAFAFLRSAWNNAGVTVLSHPPEFDSVGFFCATVDDA